MAVLKKTELCPDGSTLDAIWKVLAWSFNVLAAGKWPTTDWNFRPLEVPVEEFAGGWHGACLQMRGDWQWFCQVLDRGMICKNNKSKHLSARQFSNPRLTMISISLIVMIM